MSRTPPKTVDLVTLNRSEFGVVRPVWSAAQASAGLEARLVAGGSHLLARFGRTIEAVRAAGAAFGAAPDAELDFLRDDDDSDAAIAAAFARAAAVFAERFAKRPPDILFLVGDRWETLAAATAATMARVPIAHHSGGDITQGAADNQNRYAISQLAHLHLTALPEHSERLIAMGEEPWRVRCVGEPSLQHLADRETPPDPRAELGLPEGAPFVLATFHPSSFDPIPPEEQIACFVEALGLIGSPILLTAPNPDAGGGHFYRVLERFVAETPRARMVESLGERLYDAALAHADFMIGNSSSGIWEAPSYALPVLNLGRRQEGRARGDNVVDAALEPEAIRVGLSAVQGAALRERAAAGENPYFAGDCVEKILEALAAPVERDRLLAKLFVDPLRREGPG